MAYVDGFVLAVPKANIDAYRKMAGVAGKVWMEKGALSYVECLADDAPVGELTSFPSSCAGQGRRDRGVLLDHLRVQGRPRPDQR